MVELIYNHSKLTIAYNDINVNEIFDEYLVRKFTTHHKWIMEATANIDNANKLWENRRKQQKYMNTAFEPRDLVLV